MEIKQKVRLVRADEWDFEEILQEYLNDGYELYGNLSTCHENAGAGIRVYQLVVKKIGG